MDTTYKIIALTIYFGAMLAIGLFAFRRTDDGDDYMLGGRRLGPFTAAMSAGASDMSGWLLMGLPGALYMSGLVESWIAIGLLVGAAVNWLFIAPRLREYTALAKNSITIPSFFENRVDDRSRALRVAAGLVTSSSRSTWPPAWLPAVRTSSRRSAATTCSACSSSPA